MIALYIIYVIDQPQCSVNEMAGYSPSKSTSITVKAGQAYPPKVALMNRLIYLKNESVSRCRNQIQIQTCFPACVMSSEFFTLTSLYSVILKNLLIDKIVLKTFTSNSRKLR